HRVIGVDGRHGMADLEHSHLLMSGSAVDDRHHARLPLLGALQMADGNALFAVFPALAESLVRAQGYAQGVTLSLPFQRLFQARQQVTLTMLIGHRLGASR